MNIDKRTVIDALLEATIQIKQDAKPHYKGHVTLEVVVTEGRFKVLVVEL